MDREELKEFLPHRDPMLLVDEIEIDAEGTAHARYRIKEDEFFCKGHFPGNPIVPGVIQCEIMAQSCALLVKDEIVGKTTLSVSSIRYIRVTCARLLHILKAREEIFSSAMRNFTLTDSCAAREVCLSHLFRSDAGECKKQKV